MILAVVGGALALVVVGTLVIIFSVRRRGGERRAERGTRVSAVVLETRSQRRNVGHTGLVDYYALVRFSAPNGRSVETWAKTALPPKKWRVPGQPVLVACDPADPWNAHVERVL